ncbi:hypothetical protein GCM10023322_49060 [Rugosimonospora acidiphila]|uniref:Uncharacterized protein n=1 Tax=Rugosimonospora acidiphila TaxID=556531 RepID=A0ABP9S6U5_9ACTN
MQEIENKFDKAYHGKSVQELADAPVASLAGVSESAAELIKQALGIKTIRQLGTNQYFLAAQAIAHLAE